MLDVPAHIRIRRRGNLVFAFNYGPEEWTAPIKGDPILGEKRLKAQQVAVWRI